MLTLASATEHQRRNHVLALLGLSGLRLTRGTSYANEVWLGDELVLRINARGAGRLAREARIAARVPREARYPEIVTVGDDGELEWMVCRRARGIELGRAWQVMPPHDRERAIHELAAALAAVHATPCDDLPDDGDPAAALRPPHTLPLAPLLALVEDAPIDRGLAAELAAFVTERWPAFDAADRGLVHGDPHLENVLWDGAHVSALLDLEWSRPSWIHCDLETLLAVSDDPALFASADYQHAIDPATYADIPHWLAAARPSWIAHPRLGDRLAVLFVSRTLGHFEDGPSELRVQHLRDVLGS